MVDDVRRLSEELARDPGSRVFVPLGEALRRRSADVACAHDGHFFKHAGCLR